jgi:hypothetical protein
MAPATSSCQSARLGRWVGVITLVPLFACATRPPTRLDASGPLTTTLPIQARLALEEYRMPDGQKLAVSLRVAHNPVLLMDGMRLLSVSGHLEVSGGTGRRRFEIEPLPSAIPPVPFYLAWLGRRPDGADKQPAYYECVFAPVTIEGLAATAFDYDFTAVVELPGRQARVSGRGRALPGQWRGSYPPPEPGTATRF